MSSDGRDAPGVVQIAQRAAAAERLGAIGLALIVELHRDADDLVTLLDEQSRGDRRIDSA